MQRFKMGSLTGWQVLTGEARLVIEDHGPRTVRLDVVGQGLDVFVWEDGVRYLVASGAGFLTVEVGLAGGGEIEVLPHKGCNLSCIRIEGQSPRAGWHGGVSFTDTTPKSTMQVSPEIAAMFETMQRNMLEREQRLLREIERRQP